LHILKTAIVWWHCFKTLASGCLRGFSEKKRLNALGFAQEYLCSCTGYGPGQSVKRCGKSSSLHSRKNFLLGGCRFCEWGHKWRTFRIPWPTLPGPGHQPLGGSIMLKFYWKLGYNPSLLILWMTCWGFSFKSYDLN